MICSNPKPPNKLVKLQSPHAKLQPVLVVVVEQWHQTFRRRGVVVRAAQLRERPLLHGHLHPVALALDPGLVVRVVRQAAALEREHHRLLAKVCLESVVRKRNNFSCKIYKHNLK